MSKSGKTINLLIIVFLIETFCVTYGLLLKQLIPLFSILYFISGLAFSYLLLLLPQAKQSFSIKENAHHLSTLSFRIVAVIIMCVQLFYFCERWIEDTPLDFHEADMLPIIKVMCERFLHGDFSNVYSTIPQIWHGIKPIYLPAMWMPFCFAVAGNNDLRWITAICLMVVFTIFIFIFHPSHQRKKSPFILLAAFMLFWWTSVQQSNGLIPYTEEAVVIFYYCVLTLALLNGNVGFIAVALSFCILSRYALIGWIIPFVLLLLYEKRIRSFFVLKIIGLTIFLLLMILPFGWLPFQNLLSLPGEYIEFASRVWKSSPEVFTTSPGLAKFFGADHVVLLHRILIILSFIVPLLFVGITVWLRDKKKLQLNNIAIAAFKLTLIIFYNFIDVPFLYLFYTSSFVSLLIVGYFVSLYPKQLEESVIAN